MASAESRITPRLLPRPYTERSRQSDTFVVHRQDAAEAKAITPSLEDVWRQPRRYQSVVPGALAPHECGVVWPDTPCDVRVYGKTAVLGGSFDPPHWGTAWCVRRLLAAGARDVWLMPVAQHAEKKNQSPFCARMLMAFALVDHLCGDGAIAPERVLVTNVEGFVSSGGQTLEVMRAMRRLYSPRSFVLAVGADVGESMVRWPKYEELVREFPVVVLERPGGYRGAQLLGDSEPAIEISSTQIRTARLAGNSIDTLVPRGVFAVVREHGLYQDPRCFALSWRVGAAAVAGTLFVVAMAGVVFHHRDRLFGR